VIGNGLSRDAIDRQKISPPFATGSKSRENTKSQVIVSGVVSSTRICPVSGTSICQCRSLTLIALVGTAKRPRRLLELPRPFKHRLSRQFNLSQRWNPVVDAYHNRSIAPVVVIEPGFCGESFLRADPAISGERKW
jgi:hypothetical protein